jgi:hypothetical protein
VDEITKAKQLQGDVQPEKDQVTPEAATSNLDSEENQQKLKKLMQWRRQARVAQADNRLEMATDEDFYDGIQLTPEELAVLQRRNQPVVVYNVIANAINWILGTQRRARFDSRVLPRKKVDSDSAKAKTKMMKYIQDASKGEYEISFAFEEQVKAGLGWLEDSVRNNDDEPIFMKSERWRNIWYDHLGLSLDGSDYRFILREKWLDLDIAQHMFPDREDALKNISEGVNSLYPYLPDDVVVTDYASEFDLESDLDALFGGPFDGARERIKAIEMWYRMPARVELIKMRDHDTPYGALDGSIFRPESKEHQYLKKGNYISTNDALILTVRCAMWAGATLLQDKLSPFNHNRFPFVPLFCYRRKRDNMPYGVIRNLRDPQSDLNKRRSRSLFLLTATQVIADEGAVNDKVEAITELHKPDGWVEVNAGKNIKVENHIELANSHVELARDDERFVHNISGVTGELQDQPRTDLSGIAIKSLQNQGQMSQGVCFDNLYYAFQGHGEIQLALIEQFCDDEKEYRITGDQRKDEFVHVNKRNEDGTIENNITKNKADFVMTKQDFRDTIRQAMLSQLSELINNLSKSQPEVALKLLDMVVDLMDDLANKDEIVARIREINGQIGAEDDMSPEEKQKAANSKKQKEQQVQKQQQITEIMQQLEVAFKQAEVNEKQAKSMNEMMDGMLKKLQTFVEAMGAAGTLAANPHLAKAADNLLQEADAVVGSGKGKEMTAQQQNQ